MIPFFAQLKYAADVLHASRSPLDAGPDRSPGPSSRAELAAQKPVVIMQIAVTLIVMIGGPALIVVLRDPNIDKLVFSVIGVVVGYWLR